MDDTLANAATATGWNSGTGTLDELLTAIRALGLPEVPRRWVWDPRPGLQLHPRPPSAGTGNCPFLRAGARFFEGHAFWNEGAASRHLLVLPEGDLLRWTWMLERG